MKPYPHAPRPCAKDLKEGPQPVHPELAGHPLFGASQPGKGMGLITGDNPYFPVISQGGTAAMRQELDKRGIAHEPVMGKYGNTPENSLLIHGISRDQLHDLGRRYGQEAAVYSEGHPRHDIIYTNGPNSGRHHKGTGLYQFWGPQDVPPADNWTKLPGRGYIRLDFDWSKLHDAPAPQPAAAPSPIHTLKSESRHTIFSPKELNVAEEKRLTVPEALGALAKGLKAQVEQASERLLALRRRELRKAEAGVCLMCGQLDLPGSCTCLRKSDDSYAHGPCKTCGKDHAGYKGVLMHGASKEAVAADTEQGDREYAAQRQKRKKSVEKAEDKPESEAPDGKKGAHGWPLVDSKHFPGEKTLACPKCSSTDVMHTMAHGPGGRLGDPGGHEIVRCQNCKHQDLKPITKSEFGSGTGSMSAGHLGDMAMSEVQKNSKSFAPAPDMAMSEDCGETHPGHKWMRCGLSKGHDGDHGHDMCKSEDGEGHKGLDWREMVRHGRNARKEKESGSRAKVIHHAAFVSNHPPGTSPKYPNQPNVGEYTIEPSKPHHVNFWHSRVGHEHLGSHGSLEEAKAAAEKHHSSLGSVETKKSELEKTTPPGREEQVKALKPKVGTESAFKIAWASYDKSHKKAEEDPKKPVGNAYRDKPRSRFDIENEQVALESEHPKGHVFNGNCPGCQRDKSHKKSEDQGVYQKVPKDKKGITRTVEEGREESESVLPNDKDPKADTGGAEGGNDALAAKKGAKLGKTVLPFGKIKRAAKPRGEAPKKLDKAGLPMAQPKSTPPGTKVPLPGMTAPKENATTLVHGLTKPVLGKGELEKAINPTGILPKVPKGLRGGTPMGPGTSLSMTSMATPPMGAGSKSPVGTTLSLQPPPKDAYMTPVVKVPGGVKLPSKPKDKKTLLIGGSSGPALGAAQGAFGAAIKSEVQTSDLQKALGKCVLCGQNEHADNCGGNLSVQEKA